MARIYYLRDKKNIRVKSDGTFTKGNPMVIIASVLDRESEEIKYAVASIHPKDHFVKSRGLQIVNGRLEEKPITIRGIPSSGHEITKKIMNDIFANNYDVSRSVRSMAREWLTEASKPRFQND